MVYTSPSKVAQIIELKNLEQSDDQIAQWFNLHCTTIPRLIKHFLESGDPYFRRPKPGHPCKLQDRDIRHGAIMLARGEVANVTELTQKAFPQVACTTMSRALHEYGLISRV